MGYAAQSTWMYRFAVIICVVVAVPCIAGIVWFTKQSRGFLADQVGLIGRAFVCAGSIITILCFLIPIVLLWFSGRAARSEMYIVSIALSASTICLLGFFAFCGLSSLSYLQSNGLLVR